MAEPRPTRSTLRPDIQALRAIAVAGVVVYHLWPPALPGGFVGVDVFYVISGYLITGQLVCEATIDGRLAVTRFWARRIRRLLPAAFAVLAACLMLLFFAVPRVTWQENLLEIRVSVLYGENWLLARHSVDYLASSDSASLVQHYWSLSVEEQFYLAWPLLLLALLPTLRRLNVTHRRRVVMALLALLAGASYAYSIVDTGHDPHAAFFVTPTRVWEFAVGGLVAAAASIGHRHRRRSLVPAVANWLGLALIGVGYAVINGRMPFPGAVAAVPVGGAAMLLARDTSVLRSSPMRFANMRAVRWVGDNSYSLYLWHWPLIVAAPWVIGGPVSTTARLAILAMSLLLAAATKRFVEDPIRFRRAWRARRWPAYALTVTAMSVGIAATSVAYLDVQHGLQSAVAHAAANARQFENPASAAAPSGTPSRPPRHYSCYGAAAMINVAHCPKAFDRPPGLDAAAAAEDGRTYQCLAFPDTTSVQLCTFGQLVHPKKTIAVVGNSHARRLIPALDAYGKRHGWRIILAAKINCMGVIGVPVGNESPSDPCLVWSAGVLRDLSRQHLDAVLFASHRGAAHFLTGSYYPSATEELIARSDMLATWSSFARRGVRVIVAEDVPGVGSALDPECIAMSHARTDPCAVPRHGSVHPNVMTVLALRHPELVSYLPLHQYFCDRLRCHGLIGGLVVYFDSNHLTATYSRSMAPYLGGQLAAILDAPAPSAAH